MNRKINGMKRRILLLLVCLVGIGASGVGFAQKVVEVRQRQLPILIEREDNVLLEIRIEVEKPCELQELNLRFEEGSAIKEIEVVKLYYSGLEAPEKGNKRCFAPVEYIPLHTPHDTRRANRSYSVLYSAIENPISAREFDISQKLSVGVNYLWVSLQVKEDCPLNAKFKTSITKAKIDGEWVEVKNEGFEGERYVGVGVRHAGDEGIAAFRIPGLATSTKGTMLAVYDRRHNSSYDLQEWVEIGFSRSEDGGKTWDKMRVPLAFGEYDGLPKAQNGVGDPAILVDENSGTIWVAAVWTHGAGNMRTWYNSAQGMDYKKTAQLVLTKSEDDGKTWSEPINITPQLKDTSWYFFFQGPGRGITMKDGTLVFAAQYIDSERVPHACIIYSKDGGNLWEVSSPARSNTTEAQVAEISEGVLMINMRDNRGGSRSVAITSDMGKTWREHESSRTALQEPVCMASLIAVKAQDNVLKKDILLFSNPNATDGRYNMTIKASLDGGKTWKKANQLLLDQGGSWGYSCLSMIDSETVGILYESSTAHIVFQAIKLSDIIKEM